MIALLIRTEATENRMGKGKRRLFDGLQGMLIGHIARSCAFTLLCLCAGLATACFSASTPVVINEVVSSNTAFADETLGTPDWIELYNPSDRDVNLQGYILTDKEDRYDLENMLPDLIVPAHGYTVLFARSNANTDAFCLPFGLAKSGDTLYLLDSSGNLMEKLIIPALPKDVSYARRADGSFGYCILPTPGEENTPEISQEPPEASTPEPPEDVENASEPAEHRSEITLFINEIVSEDFPTGRFGGADWIEIFNPNDTEISLGDFFLSDRADKRDKARLPEIALAAGAYAAIPCGSGEDAIDLSISKNGESLYLYDAGQGLADSVSVPPMMKGQSWARNRNGVYGYCGSPTPGMENDDRFIGIERTRFADETEPLRLNEVLFRNTYSIIDGYGDHADFAELKNTGNEAIELSEYWLSDDFSDPLKWQLPAGTLEPGTYLLIFLTGKKSTAYELHAPFSVSGSDDGLMLYHAPRRIMQQIPRTDEIPKNTSVGLSEDGRLVFYKYPTPGEENAAFTDDVKKLGVFPYDDLHISEVCAFGADNDWIELKNGSDRSCDLSGWYLSDSEAGTSRFFLTGVLNASAYAVFAPNSFGVSATGERIYLFDPNDRMRDIFETGDLVEGYTSGRTEDPLVARVFFLQATPGEPNAAQFVTSRTPQPIVSETALYHSNPFSLRIDCSDPNAVILYTTDGSDPKVRAERYTEPIRITESVTIRFFAQSENCLPSVTRAVTYLFAEKHTIPVVCIACDPDSFSAFTRIRSQGRYPHTDAQIAFYETDGTIGTTFDADINPRGNQSIKNPQKSLSLHLRTRLGQGSVNYPFWGDGTAADYATLILRNGSQDYAKARLRDSFALYAVSGLSLDSAQTRPVVVYVNGTYYGIMDLNEGMNQDYLVTHYGADPASINFVSANGGTRYGSDTDFDRLRRYARQNPFDDDATVAEFAKWVDVEYITDYLIAQTFFCNYDVKNQSYWATSDYAIRWRPIFYDIDRCFADGSSGRNLFNDYFNRKGVLYDKAAGRIVNMDLYAALRRNPAWCDRFLHRYAELLCTEFSVARLQTLLDEVAGALRPEMERHIALYHAPASLTDWENAVASMRKEIEKRHEEIQNQLCSEFHLKRSEWDDIMRDAASGA